PADRRDARARQRPVALIARVPRPIHDPAAPEHDVERRAELPARWAFTCGERYEGGGQADGLTAGPPTHQCHVLLNESGCSNRPRTITQAMRRVASMLFVRSPSRTTRSANLPRASPPRE